MTHLLAPVSGVLAALQDAALYCNGADGACSAEWFPQQGGYFSRLVLCHNQ